ncbi:MAG TPA: FkbM family methyltransferase [Roseiarcus sp.]|jgi:FkbM family methyltransferase
MSSDRTSGRLGGVIALEELATSDRFVLEHVCRAQAQPVYLGDHTALCRILGRYKFYVDTRDQGFGSNVLLDGFWEMWLTIAIARHLRPGMVAIDIGANFGYYSLLMADLVGPEGALVAVEPNRHVTPKLRASLALNGFASRSRVIEAAAAATNEGFAHLYATVTEPKNATIVSPEMIVDPAIGAVTTTPNWTADAIAREFGRVDFIKVDAEGAEEDIIKGLRPVIVRHNPSLVLEFNAARYVDARRFLAEVMSCYQELRLVDHSGGLVAVSAETVLTEKVGEDWLLFFQGAL